MPLLNYTTSVAVEKTVAEIQTMLVKVGVNSVLFEYDKGALSGLAFGIHGAQYRLPCRSAAVLTVLCKDRNVPPRYRTPEQAQRVAWRILKDWVQAQLAIIETGMVTAQEVFLPYMLVETGETVYEMYDQRRQLADAKPQ